MTRPARDVTRWRRPEHVYRDMADIAPRSGEHIVSVRSGEQPPLDAMVDFIGSDISFVSFHAAVAKEGSTIPHFTGASLAARAANRILVSDPCLAEGVSLAWFAGSRAVSQQRIHDFVHRLLDLSGARHTVFFGGSGGGFASLDIARAVPGSVAVVANPQTSIVRFYPRWWMPYASACWGASGSEDEVADVLRGHTKDMAEEYRRARPDVDGSGTASTCSTGTPRERTCPRPPGLPLPSRPGGRPSTSPSPSRSPTPTPKASTGSSRTPSASPAASATLRTTSAEYSQPSRSPEHDEIAA